MKTPSKMFRCGLLVLNPSCFKASIPQIIKVASKDIKDVLYVDLFNSKAASLSSIYSLLLQVYARSHPDNVDVRLLLPELGQPKPRVLSKKPEIALFVNIPEYGQEGMTLDSIKTWINERFMGLSEVQVKFLQINKGLLQTSEYSTDMLSIPSLKVYDEVALGGTFDHIHDGHRLLLGVACLLCEKKITVGLSDGPLLQKKVLKELIQPFEQRKRIVEELIEDIRPGLCHNVVPLTDPIGPAGTDPNLKCLIVSKETEKGITFVNEARQKINLQDLQAHIIDIVTEETGMSIPGQSDAEGKMSSTNERHKLLGKLLRPVNRTSKKKHNESSRRPYVIGLTGGIASGKSAISKRLEKLGAAVINCDLLGHLAYEPGKKAYSEIIESFGEEVVASDGTINRKVLGSIVFTDKAKLMELNKIVWPEIMNLVEEKINKFAREGVQVCVVEAAVLLEAGWDGIADENWVTFVPEEEAITRMLSRDKMNEQQATNRVKAQMSNEDRVSHAHVVLSSLWEPEYTQKQVERAWKELQERIPASPSNQSAL